MGRKVQLRATMTVLYEVDMDLVGATTPEEAAQIEASQTGGSPAIFMRNRSTSEGCLQASIDVVASTSSAYVFEPGAVYESCDSRERGRQVVLLRLVAPQRWECRSRRGTKTTKLSERTLKNKWKPAL